MTVSVRAGRRAIADRRGEIAALSFTYQYPHMAVTVDVVLFDSPARGRILLIQRRNEPFKDHWALPGGYVDMDETVLDAAHRELAEETGVTQIDLTFLGYFDAIDRDPRERTIAIAFVGALREAAPVQAGDDARDAGWHTIEALPPLAFDHAQIIRRAVAHRTA